MSLNSKDASADPDQECTTEFSMAPCSSEPERSTHRPFWCAPSFPEHGPSDRASGATAQELKSMNLNLASGSEESDREPPGAVANSPDGLRNESQPIVSRTDDKFEHYKAQICAANMLVSELRLRMNKAEEKCLVRSTGTRTRSRVEKCERTGTHSLRRGLAGQRMGQFPCDGEGCTFSADRVGDLKWHKSVMHKYACGWEGCAYSCKSLDRLNAHRGKHTDQSMRQFSCDWEGCPFSAVRISDLKRHKLVTHRYACGWEGCTYFGKDLDQLNAHRGKHTDFRCLVGEQGKPYPCPVDGCNFSTTCADGIHAHLKRHRPESAKEHRCGQEGCTYAAIRRSDLVRHLRRHTGEKQLQCDKCSYKTGSANCLKIHRRIHTGEKFACPLSGCGYSTIYKNCFKTHMKKRHDLNKIPSTESNQNKPETSEQETCWPREQFRCFWKGCLFMSDKTAELVEHRLSHTEISLHADTVPCPSTLEAPETEPFDFTDGSELEESEREYAEVELVDSSTPVFCLDVEMESTDDCLGDLTLITDADMRAPESEESQGFPEVDDGDEEQPADTTAIKIMIPTKRGRGRPRKHRTPAQDQSCLDDCGGQKRGTTGAKSNVDAPLAGSDSESEENERDVGLDVALDTPGSSKVSLVSGSSADNDDDSDYQPAKTNTKRRRRPASPGFIRTKYSKYICGWEGCTYFCKNLDRLNAHRGKHTGEQEKPYSCPVDGCKFSATGAEHIYSHRKRHRPESEKAYRCDEEGCNYAAIKRTDLVRHLRKHTGVKPFQCDKCSYKTGLLQSLKLHRRTRTGEKLTCSMPECDYSRIYKYALSTHMKQCHDLGKTSGMKNRQDEKNETGLLGAKFLCFWKDCLFTSYNAAELVEHKLSHTETSLHTDTSSRPSVSEAPETEFDLAHDSDLEETEEKYAEVEHADPKTSEGCLDVQIESTDNCLGILTLIKGADMPLPVAELEGREGIPEMVHVVEQQQSGDTNASIEIVVNTKRRGRPRKFLAKQKTREHDHSCLGDCHCQKRKTTDAQCYVEAPLAGCVRKHILRSHDEAEIQSGLSILCKGQQNFSCTVPGYNFWASVQRYLLQHIATEHPNLATQDQGVIEEDTEPITDDQTDFPLNEREILCPIVACGYGSGRKYRVKDHLLRSHNQADIMSGLAVLYKDEVLATLYKQRDNNLSCTVAGCGYFATKPFFLSRHMAARHSEDAIKKLVCDWEGCSFKSLYKKSLIEHRLAKHTGEKPFACDLPGCTYTAVGKSAVTKHKRMVHMEPDLKLYNCGYCEKTFRQSGGRLEHERAVHSELTGKEVTKKQCPIAGCSYASHRTYRMNQHMHSHSDERRFVCDFAGCSYRAKLIDRLKAHKKSHGTAEVVKVRCDWNGCNYQTYLPGNMVLHKMTHTGEKRYHCQWEGCDYRAARQGNVKKHMVKHTGKKALKCKNCGKGYTTQMSFKLHTKQCDTGDSSDDNTVMADNEEAYDSLGVEDEAAVGVILSV